MMFDMLYVANIWYMILFCNQEKHKSQADLLSTDTNTHKSIHTFPLSAAMGIFLPLHHHHHLSINPQPSHQHQNHNCNRRKPHHPLARAHLIDMVACIPCFSFAGTKMRRGQSSGGGLSYTKMKAGERHCVYHRCQMPVEGPKDEDDAATTGRGSQARKTATGRGPQAGTGPCNGAAV